MAKAVKKVSTTKSLTVASIKNEAKILNEQLDLEVVSKITGESYTLTIDKYISNTKTIALVSEFMVQLQYAREKKINIEDILVQYSVFLVVKHFTSFGIGVPAKLESQIAIMQNLIDLDLISPIIDAFDEDEVVGIFESITKAIESVDKQVKKLSEDLLKVQLGFEDRDDVTFTQELPEYVGIITTPMDIKETEFGESSGTKDIVQWS